MTLLAQSYEHGSGQRWAITINICHMIYFFKATTFLQHIQVPVFSCVAAYSSLLCACPCCGVSLPSPCCCYQCSPQAKAPASTQAPVWFSRRAVYWSFLFHAHTKVFLAQNQILSEILQVLQESHRENPTDKSSHWWWTTCHKAGPFPRVELNFLACYTITSQAAKDPYRIAQNVI